MSDAPAFAPWLKQRRKQLGLTQDTLARRVGCATITIQKLEAGALRPSTPMAERLADHLAFTAEERLAFLEAARLPAGVAEPNPQRSDLPVAPTALIGRAPLVDAVCATLRRPEVRLLTLSGPPGVGKTRVALQVAHELSARAREHASFIPLASIQEAGLVLGRIAQALDLPEATHQSVLAQLIAALRPAPRLLVLDNFEQVLAAAAEISALLAAVPTLKVLVTSRAALHLSGEHLFLVPPLALPDLADLPAVDQLAQVPAVALFVQRTQAVLPAFVLTATNAATVAAICQRLDGLPLALELAATRCTIFAPPALLARLQNPLAVLTVGVRNLPAHQQTLRSTIAWSYDLLPAEAQALFARLGVFGGSFTLEAAAAVCTDAESRSFDGPDGFALLVGQSLVQQELRSDDEVRFRLLETIRDFAREQLAARAEEALLHARHAAYYLQLTEQAEPELRGPHQAIWYHWLTVEHDNLLAALRWAVEHQAADVGLRLAGALWWFWPIYGYVREGAQWYTQLLPLIDAVEPPVQSRFFKGAATLAWYQGQLDQAAALAQRAVSVPDNGGNQRDSAFAQIILGVHATHHGQPDQTAAYQQTSLALFRQLNDAWGIAAVLGSQGTAAFNLAQFDHAENHLRESFAYQQLAGDRWGFMYISTYLGLLLIVKGEHGTAEQMIRDGIRQALGLGRRIIIPESFEGLAAIAVANGQIERAVQFAGAAAALRDVIGSMLSPTLQSIHDRYLTRARSELAATDFARIYAHGKTMPLDRVIELALSDDEQESPAPTVS
ncbi:helix-turn-helix domain-containing protein [Candidatus Chloroploca asiatica]|uniref:HTH cro/C1-type domain-containing protein n=1 Tax=Candidatus Chloroploca asiatica TaxID=1506545 RepID=A0A2H3L6P9_9CHLR|nr:helix-turn-helix domain-containing protein [Candidatus Chloroploca asiatica]PDV97946.1 hypothetical protein A9Q02_16840 [Candidatus Chloroploca asiatica]